MNVHEIIQKYSLLECIQCGICTGSCPVSRKAKLNIRRLMYDITLSGELIIPSENELWSCTTCSTCEVRCPKRLSPFSVLTDIRDIVIEKGQVAPTIRNALESIYKQGNPWGRIRSKRSEWAEELQIKQVSEGAELLYFVGCTPSYDPRVQKVARALATCFDKAGVNFCTLGNEEGCCGSEVHAMGETALFDLLVQENLAIFDNYGIKRVVTISPHCYDAFNNRYGKTNFEVQHYTQYVADLIEENKLTFSKKVKKTIVYHDACFLGQRNNVYDEPRNIIESIPGVNLIEMDRSKERSLCCEGGGGRMWIEVPGERLSEIRVRDAVDVGAEILATACPFCLLNLEDAVKTTDCEDAIQVMDIAELVSKAI